MKLLQRTVCVLLAAVLLATGVCSAGAVRQQVGLNGASGSWSEFDASVYDLVTNYDEVTQPDFVWPDGGTVLLLEAASSVSYLINRYRGVTIPAGLVVDLYRYSTLYDTYAMQAHYDTTDGRPYTITYFTTNLGAPDEHDGSRGTAWRTFTPNVPAENAASRFRDVDPSAWYYDAVMTVTEGGLFHGYGNGEFGPDDPMTRAQVQILVSRLHGSDYEAYTDGGTATRGFAAVVLGNAMSYGEHVVPTLYETRMLLRETDYVPGLILELYTFDQERGDYVRGMVPGSNPDLAMIWMQRCIYDNWLASAAKEIPYRYTIEDFPDGAAIRQWSSASVPLMRQTLHQSSSIRDSEIPAFSETMILRAWNLGLFSGVDDAGTFDPDAPLTRAQFCQVLYNMGWLYRGCLDYNAITTSGWARRH